MYCPKCKKKSRLMTKRTRCDGDRHRREKYCPKCKSRFYTIEMFISSLEKIESDYNKEISGLVCSVAEIREKYQKVITAINVIKEAGNL